jgi:hypothetical protein
MKRLPWLLILIALAMFIVVGDGFSYMIDDNDKVIWAEDGSSYTINDNTKVLQKRSNGGGYGTTWTDVIGSSSQFNVYGIDVSFSSGDITFDMYTNFNSDGKYQLKPYEIYTYLADLALDVDQDGTYDYGVIMIGHNEWTRGVHIPLFNGGVGLYSVSSWETSFDFMDGYKSPMVYYGGKWDENDPKIPVVAVKSGTNVGNVDVTFTNIPGDNPNYKWTATFDYTLVPGLTDGFDVFWGGMTCSNDAISGSVANSGSGSSTPEPATLVLMSFGLIGLVMLGGCKMKNSCRRKL